MGAREVTWSLIGGTLHIHPHPTDIYPSGLNQVSQQAPTNPFVTLAERRGIEQASGATI